MIGKLKLIFTTAFCLIGLLNFGQSDSASQVNAWETEAEEAYKYAGANLYANTDSVINRMLQIEPEVDQIGNYTSKFNVFNILGIGYQVKSEFEVSNKYLNKAIEIANTNKDSILLLKASHNLAINNRYLGQYEKALEVFLSNLEIARLTNFEALIGVSLSEIGNVYNATENWPKALEYLRKTLNFNKERNNDRLIGTAYNSIAYIYSENNTPYTDLEKARLILDSAIIYHNKANNLVGLANAKRQQCATYRENDKIGTLQCQKELLEYDTKIGNAEGIMIDNINIGKSLTNLLKHKEAIPYFSNGLELARQLNKKRFVQATYNSLAINNYNLKNYEKAYLYADSSKTLNDSLRGIEIQESIAGLETKYQVAEKERIILEEKLKSDQLRQEKEVAELEAKQKTYWIIFLILLVSLIVLAAYFFIQNNKKKQELKEAELLKEERQKALKAVIDAQEEERKRIAKDLHDGIGQKLSGLKMAWNRISEETTDSELQNRVKELSEVLSSSADEIRSISHKMMPIALREVGLSAAIKSMLESTFRFTEMKYTYDESKVDGRFDENVEITLYRIAQELVNNAIKHAKAKEINVQLLNSGTHLILLVQDDGEGVDLESFRKGHGFMNIDSRLSVNNGEINLESTKNQGLFAQVRIKIA